MLKTIPLNLKARKLISRSTFILNPLIKSGRVVSREREVIPSFLLEQVQPLNFIRHLLYLNNQIMDFSKEKG